MLARPTDLTCDQARARSYLRPRGWKVSVLDIWQIHAEELREDRLVELGLRANPRANATGWVSKGLVRSHVPLSAHGLTAALDCTWGRIDDSDRPGLGIRNRPDPRCRPPVANHRVSVGTYISLDVDPNEREADLAAYAGREGFTWRFVVASPEVSRSLAATFGDQILSPPATPLVLLGPDGELIEKHIGIKGSQDLAALIKEHLP